MHKQMTTASTSQSKTRYQIVQPSEAGVLRVEVVAANSAGTLEIRNSDSAERGGDQNRIRVHLLITLMLVLGGGDVVAPVVVVEGHEVVGVAEVAEAAGEEVVEVGAAEVNVQEKRGVSLHAVDHSHTSLSSIIRVYSYKIIGTTNSQTQ